MANKTKGPGFYAESALDIRSTEALYYLTEALFQATQEVIGFDTVATAKELAPVLPQATKARVPGELRESIDSRVRKITGKRSGVRATITTSCGYGGYVELGTSKMAKKPFLWPAFEQNIQRLPDEVKANIDAIVGTSGGDIEVEE
jgi:HK97 gp10 family phage protein